MSNRPYRKIMRDAYIFSWYTPANLGQIIGSILYVSNAFDPFNISGFPEILLGMATSKKFVRNLIGIVLSRGIQTNSIGHFVSFRSDSYYTDLDPV